MRLGVIADIHGSLEALTAALAALDGACDRIVCLGDVVGYNADGDECARVLRERRIDTIAGNHDLMAVGRFDTSRCADKVAHAIKQTRRDLLPETRGWLTQLPAELALDGGRVLLIHGGLGDPQEYVRTETQVSQQAERVGGHFPRSEVCFFGHTHDAGVWQVDADGARRCEVPGSKVTLSTPAPGRRWLVNPGSIDAARKRGYDLAEAAIWDTESRTLEFLAIPYDHVLAEAKAVRGGYRMDETTRRLYALARFLHEKRAGAGRRLRRFLP